MKSEHQYHNGFDSVTVWALEDGDGVLQFNDERKIYLPVSECHALALALDPSHAALVAQRDRLQHTVRSLYWEHVKEEDWPTEDDYIELCMCLQPGDLGEGGA